MDNYVKPVKEDKQYYYEKETMLFLRRTLIRQGVIQRQAIAAYDSNGELVDNTVTIKEMSERLDIASASISNALKTEKMTKHHFFRRYNLNDEPLEIIELNYLCEIDGIYFFNQSRVGDYCEVTRQAVSLAKKRKSKKINGKEVN